MVRYTARNVTNITRGWTTKMTKQEEEVLRLIGFGYFDTVIAGRLGMDSEEVHKIRMEARR